MKIGNSKVQFKSTVIRKSNGDYYLFSEIPYWRLYSADGDVVQKDTGKQWRCDRVLTYKEIVEYLTKYPHRRVLIAYPRFSTKERNVYEYLYYKDADVCAIFNKYTDQLLCIFNASNGTTNCTVVDKAKTQYFWRKCFYRDDNNDLKCTFCDK